MNKYIAMRPYQGEYGNVSVLVVQIDENLRTQYRRMKGELESVESYRVEDFFRGRVVGASDEDPRGLSCFSETQREEILEGPIECSQEQFDAILNLPNGIGLDTPMLQVNRNSVNLRVFRKYTGHQLSVSLDAYESLLLEAASDE